MVAVLIASEAAAGSICIPRSTGMPLPYVGFIGT